MQDNSKFLLTSPQIPTYCMIKKLHLLLLLGIIPTGYAQLLDPKLDTKKTQIINFLSNHREIGVPVDSSSIYYEEIYSKELAAFGTSVSYYEVGLALNKGGRYLAIANENSFEILPTQDFNDDFIRIMAPVRNLESSEKMPMVALLAKVKELYEYNENPPWILKK